MLHAVLIISLILNSSLSVFCANNNNNNNNHNNNNKQQQQQQQNEETFEQDLSDTFKIETSDQGIQRVNLKCGSNSMNVVLETEKPFSGVMYTRGSFYKQQEPCFVKPQKTNTHNLEMNFQLSECQTQQNGDMYSNIVVIQNDPELIMPGDSAFSLECDFRQPRNVDVGANFQARDRTATGSRITLTSPDPANNSGDEHFESSIFNASDNVAYAPHIVLPRESTRPKEKVIGEAETEQDKQFMQVGTVETIKHHVEKDEL